MAVGQSLRQSVSETVISKTASRKTVIRSTAVRGGAGPGNIADGGGFDVLEASSVPSRERRRERVPHRSY